MRHYHVYILAFIVFNYVVAIGVFGVVVRVVVLICQPIESPTWIITSLKVPLYHPPPFAVVVG